MSWNQYAHSELSSQAISQPENTKGEGEDDQPKKSKRRKTAKVAVTSKVSKTAKEAALEAMRQARIDALDVNGS